MREGLPNRRYATAGPLSDPAPLWGHSTLSHAQIGTVLHSDLTVRHKFLGGDGGDGTPEILVDSPDCVEIQLQDVSYRGGPLGNMCG
jgi:hypothetical protein